jgi:hypothetical protein
MSNRSKDRSSLCSSSLPMAASAALPAGPAIRTFAHSTHARKRKPLLARKQAPFVRPSLRPFTLVPRHNSDKMENSRQVFSHRHPVAQVYPDPRRVRILDLRPFEALATRAPGDQVASQSEKRSSDLSISKSIVRRASRGRVFRAGTFDRLQEIVTGSPCGPALKNKEKTP